MIREIIAGPNAENILKKGLKVVNNYKMPIPGYSCRRCNLTFCLRTRGWQLEPFDFQYILETNNNHNHSNSIQLCEN